VTIYKVHPPFPLLARLFNDCKNLLQYTRANSPVSFSHLEMIHSDIENHFETYSGAESFKILLWLFVTFRLTSLRVTSRRTISILPNLIASLIGVHPDLIGVHPVAQPPSLKRMPGAAIKRRTISMFPKLSPT